MIPLCRYGLALPVTMRLRSGMVDSPIGSIRTLPAWSCMSSAIRSGFLDRMRLYRMHISPMPFFSVSFFWRKRGKCF